MGIQEASLLCWLPFLPPPPLRGSKSAIWQPGVTGSMGPSLGLRGPRLPTTFCQCSASSEWSIRMCANPITPTASRSVSARLPATCPDYS